MKKIVRNEFIRFVIVGCIAAAIHYAIYWIILRWVNPEGAYTIGYFGALIVNFILSNRFTFRTRLTLHGGLGFSAAHGVNYLLHIAFLSLFLWMGVVPMLAPIPTMLLAIPINFILVRTVLRFKQ